MMRILVRLAMAFFVFYMVGCASPPRKKELSIFFPPAPELPRIQYLTSFGSSRDIEEQSSFNKFVVGEKQIRRIDKPYGVAIYDGKIYVCDTNDTVIVLDLKAKSYGPLAGATGPGKLIQPLNISIDENGNKFVTDPLRGQVVVFNRNDEYVRAYGKPGEWKPVDAVPFEDRLYVVDNKNSVVRVFDLNSGELVKSIGNSGEVSQQLILPTNLAFDSEGYLYVTDVGRFQVVKFDRDGHFRSTIGKLGDNFGHFSRPKGIAVDREGRIYVVDASFNNVQIFNREGRLLMFWGQGGTAPGELILPAKVAIDYNNIPYFQQYANLNFQIEYLILVTSQLGERSVSVLAYGKEKGKKYPTDEELLKQIQEKRRKELEKLQQRNETQ